MLRFDVVFGLLGVAANRRPSLVDAMLRFGDVFNCVNDFGSAIVRRLPELMLCFGSAFPS
jgi:hypothetical protein